MNTMPYIAWKAQNLTMLRFAAQLAILKLEQTTIDDGAALYVKQFKEDGITKESLESRIDLQNILAQSSFATNASDLVKRLFEKAISSMATEKVGRPIGADIVEWMCKVLTLKGHDNEAWKRLHGEVFPSELTEAGWRDAFETLIKHVEGFLD
jgi:hypothetical protein